MTYLGRRSSDIVIMPPALGTLPEFTKNTGAGPRDFDLS
jgi:hypothetical protein